jgi:transcriptional regulator with XRE-family HTH domain
MGITTLGERLRELREAANMSLRELARDVGVSAAFISDIELGKRYPSDDVLKRIAAVLQTSRQELSAYDTRPPLEEIKRKSQANPAYGFALRRLVREDVSSDELLRMLDRLKKKKEDKK